MKTKHKKLIFIGSCIAFGLVILTTLGLLFDVFYLRSNIVVVICYPFCIPALIAGRWIGHFFASKYIATIAVFIVQGVLYGILGTILASIIFKDYSEDAKSKEEQHTPNSSRD